MSRLSKIYGSETFILIPEQRTFVRGMSGLIDSAASEMSKNYSMGETPKEADARAIAADWRVVGKDLEIAYEWGGKEIAR